MEYINSDTYENYEQIVFRINYKIISGIISAFSKTNVPPKALIPILFVLKYNFNYQNVMPYK